jgi:hypothetical protein
MCQSAQSKAADTKLWEAEQRIKNNSPYEENAHCVQNSHDAWLLSMAQLESVGLSK